MNSQWQNFLKNIGEWQGSFAQLSPQGELITDIPSHLTLESFNDNQTARLTLKRFYPNSDPTAPPEVKELVREYQSLGRDLLFFENGAFSQGTIQLSPVSQSGAEFGFIYENQRLRLVELFNTDGQLESLTLIREKRRGTDIVKYPPFTIEALLGEWRGEAMTIYPDLRSPESYSTRMQLQLDNDHQLQQNLTFGVQETKISSKARIDGSILYFDQGKNPVKVILLPDGASATIPEKVELGKPCFFEAGWLIRPNLRQRLIRQYNGKGEWVSLTLVTEQKQS
ncbi:conserved hypothetical protein [Planktothrix sp. PCC 11201]|uniref:DUF3598 family protein n=1 Tax=Planktothrix sp. PCC 11201 TaxID=1729650 RepID=UPI00092164A1|nr:DUF3598 family protein [Planktothrix sp. PCC 11201]SKB16146.1 conserved hypothetical protein [Planktothrix sp. PCC 11201]